MRVSAMLSRSLFPVLAAVAFAAACQDAPHVAPSGETRVEVGREFSGGQAFDSSSDVSVAGAGLSCPRSLRISMRFSASSRRA